MLVIQTVNLLIMLQTRLKLINLNYLARNAEAAVTHNNNLACTVRVARFNLPLAHAQIAARHIIKVFCNALTGNVFKPCLVKW